LQTKGGGNHSPPLSRATSPLNHDYDNGLKIWHLVRHEWDNDKDGERHNKMVSEIYLTRLLATKGTLQVMEIFHSFKHGIFRVPILF